METIATESISYNTTIVTSGVSTDTEPQLPVTVYDADDLTFELGAWLAGLRAFDRTNRDIFAGEADDSQPDLKREFRIASAALRRCSRLAFRLKNTLQKGDGVRRRNLETIAASVRDACLLGSSLSEARDLSTGEWRSWTNLIDSTLVNSDASEWFIKESLSNGSPGVPKELTKLFANASMDFSERSHFDEILPRVGTILRLLEVVGKILRNDEPLKPALVIFAVIYDQTQQLILHINNRISRFPDQEVPLFESLDSAAYGASLELKKVFQQELRGIVGVLAPTSVYARIETAYSLLVDTFQQILIDLARYVDPKASPFAYFPRLQLKLDQSLLLREHLWQILKVTRKAEEAPETSNVEVLQKELADFLSITIRFLHYKDEETFDRFNEEIHAAKEKKDLVPILHRFGAYLETLFGQVCMRAVFADHPFEQS